MYWIAIALALSATTQDDALQDDALVELKGKTLVGHHRLLSSTEGFRSYNSQKARTLLRIDEIGDGKFRGRVSQIGLNWHGETKHLIATVKGVREFSGQYEGRKFCITISEKGVYSDEREYQLTSQLHGYFDDGNFAGHLSKVWSFSDGAKLTYGGTFELREK